MTKKDTTPKINSISDLYKEFESPIFRYLLRATGSCEIAEELTQETFFQALLSINSFKGYSKVSTWLFKVARNVYLSHLRKQGRKKNLEEKLSEPLNKGKAPIGGQPEEALEQKIQQENIKEILKILPEQYSTIIILKEIEGLSHKEIAEILDKSIPSTKVLLFRAKQRFQEEYERLEGDW